MKQLLYSVNLNSFKRNRSNVLIENTFLELLSSQLAYFFQIDRLVKFTNPLRGRAFRGTIVAKGGARMRDAGEYAVRFLWDTDAVVWVATSDDVPGLVFEDASFDALTARVRDAIPELLTLNRALSGQG